MKQILYAKYNRTRDPKFQTSTMLIQEDGEMYVEKHALQEGADTHITSFVPKHKLLTKLYCNLQPCDVEAEEKCAKFQYISGCTVADIIEHSMGSLDSVLNQMEKYMNLIFSYNKESVTSFQPTDEFNQIFGEHKELEGLYAITGGDIDVILDNVIETCEDKKLYTIDYEWCFDFAIPVEYIKFRCLYYFYNKNYAFFHDKIELPEYLEKFGVSQFRINLYEKMDDCFQQYVHGENRKYIYTWRYQQKTHGLKHLMNQWNDIEGEVVKRDQIINDLNNLVNEERQANAQRIQEKDVLIAKKDVLIAKKDSELVAVQHQLDRVNNDYIQVINSLTWRMTLPMRKLLNIPSCIKEHGWKYTIRYGLTGHFSNQQKSQNIIMTNTNAMAEDEMKSNN